nr:MAG TPA: hypothetical protein [Caudoviricetes sp.]DAH04486.1 MAG TPA: hypothetical protein [Caudoviricetes sp.]
MVIAYTLQILRVMHVISRNYFAQVDLLITQ